MTTMNATTLARVYTDTKAAPKPAAGERLITARFRSPARSASVMISSAPWEQMAAKVPSEYASLLAAVLETAAKSILSKRLESMAVWPREIDISILNSDAILQEASGANSEWMTREELEAAWQASATRAAFTSSPNYTQSKPYRQAVEAFKDLVLKLAGKTSQYQPEELDKILAKMQPTDLESDFGGFIIKRIEALKSRPAKSAIDLDIL